MLHVEGRRRLAVQEEQPRGKVTSHIALAIQRAAQQRLDDLRGMMRLNLKQGLGQPAVDFGRLQRRDERCGAGGSRNDVRRESRGGVANFRVRVVYRGPERLAGSGCVERGECLDVAPVASAAGDERSLDALALGGRQFTQRHQIVAGAVVPFVEVHHPAGLETAQRGVRIPTWRAADFLFSSSDASGG